jgi:hypothetical protein
VRRADSLTILGCADKNLTDAIGLVARGREMEAEGGAARNGTATIE